MDQVIAEKLRAEPARLNVVVKWITERLNDPDYSVQSQEGLREWLELIQTEGLDGVLKRLADRTDEAARMRQNSPFGILMPDAERLEILRRYEALRPRTRASRS